MQLHSYVQHDTARCTPPHDSWQSAKSSLPSIGASCPGGLPMTGHLFAFRWKNTVIDDELQREIVRYPIVVGSEEYI